MARLLIKLFTPEFRNRLDSVVRFSALSKEVISKVVDKELLEVERQLLEKEVQMQVDEAAREWIADNGYDESMGARPLGRLIQEEIKRGLADELLFGKLQHGGQVNISVKDQKLDFEIIAKKANKDDREEAVLH